MQQDQHMVTTTLAVHKIFYPDDLNSAQTQQHLGM